METKKQKLRSAKELRGHLELYRHNLVKGGTVDLQGISRIVAARIKADPKASPDLKNLANLVGENGLSVLNAYWQYRDNVGQYQTVNNISAVWWDAVEWLGEIIRFPVIDDQLRAQPQDEGICARYKDKLVDKYLGFCDRHALTIYQSNSLENQTIITGDYVKLVANEYNWAWLGRSTDQIEFSLRLVSGTHRFGEGQDTKYLAIDAYKE